ncbi:MAG: GAF domain-containing protein [bacterium]
MKTITNKYLVPERKREEDALHESERRYRSLFENMLDGYAYCKMLFHDGQPQDFIYVDVNPAFETLTGLKNAVGQKVSQLIPGIQNSNPELFAIYGRVALTGKPEKFETYLRSLGIWFSISVFSPAKEYFVAVFENITERKKVESSLQVRMRLMEFAATHSLEQIFQKTLDEVGEITDSPIGFYHLVEVDQKTLSLQAWSTRTLQEFCTAQGKGLHYSISDAGVWVDCVHQRRPVIHNDYASLPHRKGMPEGHAQLNRELVVPVMRGDSIVAILGVGNKPSDYTEKDAELVSYLADVAWAIADRKRAEEAIRQRSLELQQLTETLEQQVQERTEELVKANQDLRDLSLRLLSAHEEERKRVAGEIHDTIGACLSAVKFKVEDVLRQLEQTTHSASERLRIIIPVVQESIDECRRIQMDLRPAMLDDLGLLPTLSWFFRKYQTIYSGIRFEQEIDIQEDEIPHVLKIIIYRVTQEGINNSAKHSRADLVRLSLRKLEGRLELVLKDNGQGFDLKKVLGSESTKRGLGLTSMRERTDLSGGSFAIESVEGKGTIVRASWPF